LCYYNLHCTLLVLNPILFAYTLLFSWYGVYILRLWNISPLRCTDILAAGVALGHAGEWEALRGYLKSSYKASQLGQVRHDTRTKCPVHFTCSRVIKHSCMDLLVIFATAARGGHDARVRPVSSIRRSTGTV
jgi:hypothetical protein